MLFKKNKKEKDVYQIVFCDDKDITTEIGREQKDYPTYEAAKNVIFSKNCGWGKAIEEICGDMVRVDGDLWLIIQKITKNC